MFVGLIPQVTIVVLGNKLDKQNERRVDSNMAQNWAKNEKVRLWEVSVVDRRTLIEPFVYLASKMTQPQSKSTFPLSRNKNKGSGSTDSWRPTLWRCVEEEKRKGHVAGIFSKKYWTLLTLWRIRWWVFLNVERRFRISAVFDKIPVCYWETEKLHNSRNIS